MSEQQISLRELREWAEAMKPVAPEDTRRESVLALVEAVEAAHGLTERADVWSVKPGDIRTLRAALARFKDYA